MEKRAFASAAAATGAKRRKNAGSQPDAAPAGGDGAGASDSAMSPCIRPALAPRAEPDGVASWLEAHGFPATLRRRFLKQRVDAETLLGLSEVDLKLELGMKILGDRRRLMRLISALGERLLDGDTQSKAMAGEAFALDCGAAGQQTSGCGGNAVSDKNVERPEAVGGPRALHPPSQGESALEEGRQEDRKPTKRGRVGSLGKAPVSAGRSRGPRGSAEKGAALPSSTESMNCPGLPESGPSKRQSLRCELLDVDKMREVFGYGGPARPVAQVDSVQIDTQEREESIKNRIRKMLELAYHARGSEPERAQAWRNAQRMLRAHNLEEADIGRSTDHSWHGGVFAAKLTATQPGKPVQNERWVFVLADATVLAFDVQTYLVSRQHSLYIVFYGSCANAELAAYAFACAANLVDWMAGGRALPKDKKFTFGRKHHGEFFSDVLEIDPGYVEWATEIERKNPQGAAKCLQEFIEYARAKQNPHEWDMAYKEGMANGLLRKAKESNGHEEQDPQSQVLATRCTKAQEQVLRYFNISLQTSSTKAASSYGFRDARASGEKDAAVVQLGQRQIQEGTLLALDR